MQNKLQMGHAVNTSKRLKRIGKENSPDDLRQKHYRRQQYDRIRSKLVGNRLQLPLCSRYKPPPFFKSGTKTTSKFNGKTSYYQNHRNEVPRFNPSPPSRHRSSAAFPHFQTVR